MSEHSVEKDVPACRGCGARVDPADPIPEHCGQCPPWTCDGCGQPCSMTNPCACWISLDGMALADLKALFAASDLSLTRDLPPGGGRV